MLQVDRQRRSGARAGGKQTHMHVIVVASRKGGAGKTTLAAHLAVEADKRGDGPVATIDADPMQGLTGWFDERKSEKPLCVSPETLAQVGLRRTLAALEDSGIALVIIDTPPAVTSEVAELIGAADL